MMMMTDRCLLIYMLVTMGKKNWGGTNYSYCTDINCFISNKLP